MGEGCCSSEGGGCGTPIDATTARKLAKLKASEKSAGNKWCLYLIIISMAAGLIMQVALMLFPDRPATVDLADSAALKDIFYGGAPHLVLCTSVKASEADNEKLGAFYERVQVSLRHTEAAASGPFLAVKPVQLACDAPLPRGGTIASKFGISMAFQPAMAFAGFGAKPKGIPAAIALEPKKVGEHVHRLALDGVKVRPLSKEKDLGACLNARLGGCAVIVHPKGFEVDAWGRAAAVAHPSLSVASLDVAKGAITAADKRITAALAEAAAAVSASGDPVLVTLRKAGGKVSKSAKGSETVLLHISEAQPGASGLSADVLSSAVGALSDAAAVVSGDTDAMTLANLGVYQTPARGLSFSVAKAAKAGSKKGDEAFVEEVLAEEAATVSGEGSEEAAAPKPARKARKASKSGSKKASKPAPAAEEAAAAPPPPTPAEPEAVDLDAAESGDHDDL